MLQVVGHPLLNHNLSRTCETVQVTTPENVRCGKDTALHKIWKKKKETTTVEGFILLNVLAALYGSSNVANRIVADATPSLPASLTCLVRFTAALVFFTPALLRTCGDRNIPLLLAGAELGSWSFAATGIGTYLYYWQEQNLEAGVLPPLCLTPAILRVIFVPIMEFFAGRQSGSKFTKLATLAAIFGMGLLEEEGFGWRGISCPQIGDLWGVAVSVISAIHIFRSEAHGSRFNPLCLNAVQCGVLALLSLGWETHSSFNDSIVPFDEVADQIQSLPWAPLIYNGLVCFGLCSWLELHGLRSIHASTATLVYTTIPVWSAFLSFITLHDTSIESAVIGASVIVFTGIYAKVIMETADNTHVYKSRSNTIRHKPSRLPMIWRTKNVIVKDDTTSTSVQDVKHLDYHPGALLTSQLKFPYYAAQAKRLLAEVKIKLGVLKSILSTSMFTAGLASPSSNNGAGAPTNSTTNGASNMGEIAHLESLQMSNTSQHIAHAHLASSGADAINTTYHSLDLTSGLNIGVQALTAMETAVVAVGSDIMHGFETAEDAITLMERVLRIGIENVAHTVSATTVAGWGALLSANNITPPSTNFVEPSQMQHLHQALSGDFALFSPSHLADAVTTSILQLMDHLH